MAKRKHDGWVLKTPRGKLIAETFALTEEEAWGPSYSYLYATTSWAKKYWKLWDESIKAARKRGYKIVKVRLVVVR